MELYFLAVQGSCPFGCYSLLGAYPQGDAAGKAEVQQILASFQSLGEPETTYGMWYSDNIGIKLILDNSLALGSVWETELQLSDGVAEVISIYPTEAAMEAGLGNLDSADSGGVEVGYVSAYGYETPEALLDSHAAAAADAGGSVGERYSAHTGGADWICQNYAIGEYYFSSAAADIDGNCFYVSAMYSGGNQEAVVAMCNQVMASVRPW